MRLVSKTVGMALAILIIGAHQACTEAQQRPAVPENLKPARDTARVAKIIPTQAAQQVFDDAIRHGRKNKLEEGGCATLVHVIGRTFWIAEARVSSVDATENTVVVVCKPEEVRWHTHYTPATRTTAGCEQGSYDWPTNASVELVICGIGRDSIVPFYWRKPRFRSIAPIVPKSLIRDSSNFRSQPDGTTVKKRPAAPYDVRRALERVG